MKNIHFFKDQIPDLTFPHKKKAKKKKHVRIQPPEMEREREQY